MGISHKTAPVEIREKVCFDGPSCRQAICSFHKIPGVEECVLLSTCNRTEIYAFVSSPPDELRKRIEDVILELSDSDREILTYFYYRKNAQAIEHLFKVSSGLDSMILGEPQIFGQVKNAYSTACDSKCTASYLNRLFHHAFRVGKVIRNVTAVGEGTVSVSFAAVILAKRIFGNLHNRSVLLVGAGKTGELCAHNLIDSGVEHLYITNRTADRAKELSDKLGGKVIPFEELYNMCEYVDIIITSVTSKEAIITESALLLHSGHRKKKPLLLIDLGVPRNIDSKVANIDDTYLCNIDDLEDLTLDTLDKRKNEAEKAEALIAEEVEEFCSWLSEREVIPTIRDLHVKMENIRQEELAKIKRGVSPETYETLDLVTRRIVRRILHYPVIAMKDTDSGKEREQLVKSIQ